MSKEALAKVVQRAISDGAFRRQLSSDPATALRGFDLTADETAAIRSGDAGRLTAMGVELRMSKAFTLSTDNAPSSGFNSGANSVLSNDLGASYTGAMNAGANLGMQSGANSALLSGADLGMQSGANSALISGVNRGEAVLDDGSAAGRDGALIPGDLTTTHAALDDTNAAGSANAAYTGGDNAFNPGIISTEGPTSASALTTGDGSGAASAADTILVVDDDQGFLTSVNIGGDNATDSILVVDDDNVSGAASPGEAIDGPTIQQ